ncbi:MAG: amino acid permease [Bacteroides sp.]|nr:amino acid permease [Bacteroides sp.]
MLDNEPQPHKFGLITASAFVIANMIGTGVFISLGFLLLATTNFITILLLWLFGGVIALCGALVYGELSAAMPRSGGEYHFLRVIYHPIVGFMSGWASLIVGFAAPVALASMAFGTYISKVYPLINPTCTALVVLTVITLIHAYDLKIGGAVQRCFTYIKIVIILIFIICGFVMTENPTDISTSWTEFSSNEIFSSGFAISLIWIYYSYSGWNASAYMANEIKNPRKTIPRSLFISTLVVTVLYILLNAVFYISTPIEEMKGQLEIGLIAAQSIFGIQVGNIMGIIIALLLFSSISSMVFLGPRVSQVMGEDTYILRPLAIRSRKGTPYIAIWAQFIISFLLIITDSFVLVTKYTGIILSFFSMLTVAGVFIHRKRFPLAERPYKTWGYPFVPIIFIALIFWSIVYLVYEDYMNTFVEQTQSVMWMTIMSILTLLTGVILYGWNQLAIKHRQETKKTNI